MTDCGGGGEIMNKIKKMLKKKLEGIFNVIFDEDEFDYIYEAMHKNGWDIDKLKIVYNERKHINIFWHVNKKYTKAKYTK